MRERKNNKRHKLDLLIFLAKIISIIPASLGLLMLADIFLPAQNTDAAIIHRKSAQMLFGSPAKLKLHATGEYSFSISVSKRIYDRTQIGDTLRIDVSRYFMRWKKLVYFKNGVEHASTNPMYFAEMAVLGLCFFLPLRIFRIRKQRSFVDIFDERAFQLTWLRHFFIWAPYVFFTVFGFYYWGQVYKIFRNQIVTSHRIFHKN